MSNDTTSAVSSSNLSAARHSIAGLSERSSKAYFAGGVVNVVTADRLTFSGDSTGAQSSANLSQGRNQLAGMNGNSTKGYWAGGNSAGSSGTVATADKITFSGDSTSAQSSANLSFARVSHSAGSDGAAKGYWCWGDDAFGSGTLAVDKIVVSTDTTSFLGNGQFQAFTLGCGSDGNKFMCYGGSSLLSSPAVDGSKVTFATDAQTSCGGSLSQARYYPCGFSGAGL